MIGKLTGSESVALATNQAESATAHIIPDTIPGNITRGYTLNNNNNNTREYHTRVHLSYNNNNNNNNTREYHTRVQPVM